MSSAIRFEPPITLVGRTALSVEIRTNRSVPTSGCGLHHVRGAEDVRVERLLRMVLEDRHVLVGGGVEHHLRPVLAEHLEHPLAIADVGQDR